MHAGSQGNEIMGQVRSRATAFLDAKDVEGACLEWDAYICQLSLSREQPSAYLAYEALMERLALPSYVPTHVITAAQECLIAGREVLTEAVQADFEMILMTALFDTGGATFLEALQSTLRAVEITAQTDGVGLAPLRAFAQLGHLAAAYVDIGAHGEAAAQVGKALGLLGLSPLPAVDQASLSQAVRRLVSGLDLPLIQLGVPSSAPGGTVSASRVESISWIRQLESEVAVLRGDWATAIAICQALSVTYGGRGDAMAVNAAQIMVDHGLAADAADLVDRLSALTSWESMEDAATVAAAQVAERIGDLTSAAAWIARARALQDLRPNVTLEPDLALVSARVARREGDLDRATRFYLDAVSSALQRRKAGLGLYLDNHAMRAVMKIADEVISYLLTVDAPSELLWVTESVKSARLAATLQARTAEGSQTEATPQISATQGEGAQTRLRHRELLTANAIELQLVSQRLQTADESQLRDLRSKRAGLVATRERLLSDAQQQDPVWLALSVPTTRPVDLVTLLGHEVTALSLYRTGSEVVATLLHEGSYKVGVSVLDEKRQMALSGYCANLTSAYPVQDRVDPIFAPLTIESFVPDALLDALLSARRLVVSPHEELHMLPWALMTCRGKRLVEQGIDVAVAPNLTCLQYLPTSAPTPRLAIFGPPADADLPFAQQEVAAIEALGQHRIVAKVSGEGATVGALIALLTGATATTDAVHVCSHGYVDTEHPQMSGILCADRGLDVADLYGVGITAPELVTTACLLGWRSSQRLEADEAVGLSSALLAAGAGSVVGSFAAVDDEASALLASLFYERRFAGQRPLAAWASAQRAMLESRFRVGAWCGFTFFGAA